MTAVASDRTLLTFARRAGTEFGVAPIPIDAARILRMHGYRDIDTVRRRVRTLAVEMAELAPRIVQAAVRVRCLSFRRAACGVLVFDDGSILQCDAFERYLCDCDEVVLFVLSAGVALDEQIAHFMHESAPVKALFLNTAGWLCVERMTRQLAFAIKSAAAAESLQLTRRMGPGYTYRINGVTCSWALEQQRTVFALLGEPQLAVTLLDSGGMQPQMSRSGLFGLRHKS